MTARFRWLASAALLVLASFSFHALASSAPALSDVIRAKRPVGGEWVGLYLLDKKVGYLFSDLTFAPGSKDKLVSVQTAVFKVTIGGKTSERFHKETRVYEAKPDGRLLSFLVESKGDGGEQTVEGTTTPAGLTVVIKRPGQVNQIRNLPLPKERVEDSDQARVALYRNGTVEGTIIDGDDLEQYKVTSLVRSSETKTIAGVKVKLHKIVTVSEKEKIPAEAYYTDDGAMVEVDFGSNMVGRTEPENVATQIDKAEVFGLTRVIMPKAIPDPRAIPNAVSMVITGLPERFWKNTYRQHFKRLASDKVEMTVSAFEPKVTHKVRPLPDPNGGENLRSTLVVESDNPEIQATARRIVGGEKDAYAAAKKIVRWVGASMQKDYGASADRATDVLRQMKGDCTEHSLLSVALLRAAGIPARRVDGVVYLQQDDGQPALYWHEWVEAYVGEWTQLDPTFGEDVADATHLAFGEEGNAEIVSLIGTIKVLDDGVASARAHD